MHSHGPTVLLAYHLRRWQGNCQRICCILNSDKMRRVECPSPPSHAEQRRLITEGGDGRDGHEYSSGNFLIKELSTLSRCAAALWIGNHVSIEGSFIASCSSERGFIGVRVDRSDLQCLGLETLEAKWCIINREDASLVTENLLEAE